MGKRGPQKGNGGAPRKEIDFEQFEELCKIQCVKCEIAAVFKMKEETLQARVKEHYGETFSCIYKELSKGGLSSLRRAQWSKGVNEKNTAMLIWLGKQYLGQTDKVEKTDKTDYAELLNKVSDRMR